MARIRTTKKLAQRIDLNYFKRPNPLRRARFMLSVVLLAIASLWLAWHGIARDTHVYSAGQISPAHAVLSRECAACHVLSGGAFRARAENQACLDCHDGPIHHANQRFTPDCAACHAEHRGAVRLAATSDANCVQCHRDLQSSAGSVHVARSISNFADGHPQFAVIRDQRRDTGTIKFNHAVHLHADLRGPKGPNHLVQLECGDCHRPSAAREPWRFADANMTSAPAAGSRQSDFVAAQPSRALMAPPKFAQTCSACHLLQFDKRFAEGVPHDKPEIVHAFVVKKFQEHLAAHPDELRVPRDPDRNVTEKPITPSLRVLTPTGWVTERTAEAENLLWRKTCQQCHTLNFSGKASLPEIAASNITVRWMPRAKFDHDAHRGFTCTSCHSSATHSRETSDVLLPSIATCQTCHASGENHAESRCFECHAYHDWSQRKEVKPKFAMPKLRSSSLEPLQIWSSAEGKTGAVTSRGR